MAGSIKDEILILKDEMIQIRRDFHQHPELSFEEKRTAGIIAKYLTDLGLKVQTGIGGTGVVGLLSSKDPGNTLLLRADMDALPIKEQNEVKYKSQNDGIMHACGHDGHMAIVLTVAKILSRQRKEFSGHIKFVFQPAEEGPGGAKLMIDAGVMKNPKVDAAIGLHLWNNLPIGTIGIRRGPTMASMDLFTIKLLGKGGHGAMAHGAVDAIIMSGEVLSAIQTIASREISPLRSIVVHVGTIHGGCGFNIVADQVELRGTVRALDSKIQKTIPKRMKRILKGITAAMRGDFELDYQFGYPVLINDPSMTELVRKIVTEVVGDRRIFEIEPTMVGEDMAFFLREVPGCFFFVGSANNAKGLSAQHHGPFFDFDEEAMVLGTEIMTKATLNYLRQT